MAKPLIRLRAVQVSFAAGILVVLGRAAQLQLVQGAEHAEEARAQRTTRVDLPAARGAIFDRNGVPLALTQEIYHVGVAPNELKNQDSVVALLADRLNLSQRAVRGALQQRYAYFHGPYSSIQVRDLRRVRGVHLTSELQRFYPSPGLARMVLGRPEAPGRPASGLERVYDSLLTGVDGSAVVLLDRAGRPYESPSRLDAFPVPGDNLYVTLDAELQEIVEEALSDAVQRFDAEGGDVVVMNPRTGEILAVASYGASGPRPATVFASVFEPGSTAKIFAAAALLSRGLASPDDRVWTERGRYQMEHRLIEDDHRSEWLTLREVIAQSSNIGIVKFASRLTPDEQYTTLRAFGLGTPTTVEYPVESAGILKHPDEWSGTTAAGLAMGYEVAVTPLQLAQAYAAIADDGIMMRPTLVREVRTRDGTVVFRQVPEPVRRVISPDVGRTLKDMLFGVVYRGGTGETAALSSFEVAGKTGTSRRAGPGGYVPGSYWASFVSLFPADDPQLVMVVKIDDPSDVYYARLTAAPVTREILERLLATRSGVLDRGRLTSSVSGPVVESLRPKPTTTVVVPWPPETHGEADTLRIIPDVTGLSLREAARMLHASGFRVRVKGWGKVRTMDPLPGTADSAGAVVTVTAGSPEGES